MKKHLVIALLCGLALANTSRVFADDVVIDTIVAVVNEGVVLSSELQAEVTYLKLQAKTNNQNLPEDEVFRKRVLERMIDQQIQSQHAARLGIAVDASSINRAVEQVAQGNGMSSEQFQQTLVSQGFDYDYYRKSIATELLLSRLVQRDVQSRIRVTKQEIDDYVSAANKGEQQQRYRVQHILLAVPASAAQAEVEKARTKANSVLAKLRAGQGFAETAAANSDGARALEGGDLGWRVLQELPEFLATALVDMSVGDINHQRFVQKHLPDIYLLPLNQTTVNRSFVRSGNVSMQVSRSRPWHWNSVKTPTAHPKAGSCRGSSQVKCRARLNQLQTAWKPAFSVSHSKLSSVGIFWKSLTVDNATPPVMQPANRQSNRLEPKKLNRKLNAGFAACAMSHSLKSEANPFNAAPCTDQRRTSRHRAGFVRFTGTIFT